MRTSAIEDGGGQRQRKARGVGAYLERYRSVTKGQMRMGNYKRDVAGSKSSMKGASAGIKWRILGEGAESDSAGTIKRRGVVAKLLRGSTIGVLECRGGQLLTRFTVYFFATREEFRNSSSEE